MNNSVLPKLQPGCLFGAYRIIRQLDAGGMGMVFEAEHVNLKARCALKIFSTASQQKEFLRKRFLAEGKMLAAFRHPRIVRVTDLALDEASGVPYFAMDLVLSPDGTPKTLAKAKADNEADEDSIAMWLGDICEGLAYVHEHGVVHRDISLDNVMIGPDGHAVITDFGIARIFDQGLRQRVDLTRFTMVEVGGTELRMGKVHYMAPELTRKIPLGASPASDAWAVGISIFRLLTGFWYERERRENSFAMLEVYEHDWEPLLSKLLSDDPGQRLPEGGIAAVPGLLVKREDSGADELSEVERKELVVKHMKWWVAVLAFLLFSALAAAIWLWQRPLLHSVGRNEYLVSIMDATGTNVDYMVNADVYFRSSDDSKETLDECRTFIEQAFESFVDDEDFNANGLQYCQNPKLMSEKFRKFFSKYAVENGSAMLDDSGIIAVGDVEVVSFARDKSE